MVQHTKKCCKCSQVKPLSEYHKNNYNKDGHQGKCKVCRSAYLLDWNKKNKDKRQATLKKYRNNNQESIKRSWRKWYSQNKEKAFGWALRWRKSNPGKVKVIQDRYQRENKVKRNKQSKIWGCKSALYETYHDQLCYAEKTDTDGSGVLFVFCAYCGQKFVPTNGECRHRVSSLNGGNGHSECRFYCSVNCKKACPTFKQQVNYKGIKINNSSREVQPELRQMAMARDEYECQICGSNAECDQLHCHHIKSVAREPVESADLDNVVTLCKSCHRMVHKYPGCGYHELKCPKDKLFLN